MNLFTRDIQAGVFVIRGCEARLVTKVVAGTVTYCKFSADTGEPYGQPPAACQVKTFLTWAERLASFAEAARYDPAAIVASSNQVAEKLGAELLVNFSLDGFLAAMERQRSERRPTP